MLAIALALSASIGTALAARGGSTPETPAKPDTGKGKHGKSGEDVTTPTPVAAPFTEALAFATKTGFRGVVTWEASAPVAAEVKWGLAPDALTQSLIVKDAPDTAGIAVIDQLEIGTTYYVTITDRVTGAVAGPISLLAGNAYNNYDTAAGAYTLNVLVQLDSQSLPAEIPADQALTDIAAGVNVFAERVYDALDGNARLGKVVVADTQIAYAVNEPFGVEESHAFTHEINPCGADRNLADVLVQTTIPFDSHTFGWAIDEPCTSFYVGREGQLVVPWEDDLHFGYVSTHEMMHYAFGAPDLYDLTKAGTGCRNLAWDGSLMHNTGGWAGTEWELTELDRSATQTPCDTQYDPGFTWDYLQQRYTQVLDGPIEHMFDVLPRGNEDGGALDIRILDRNPASSTLTAFTPDDSNPEILGGTCAADQRSTTFEDPRGDATRMLVDSGQPALSDPALDVVGGGLAYVDVDGSNTPSQADTLTFTVDVDDLTDLPATASQGEYFDFTFSIGAHKYYAAAQWDHVNPPTFELGELETTRVLVTDKLQGTWDVANDRVTYVAPAVVFPPPPGPMVNLPDQAPDEAQDVIPSSPADLLPEETPAEVRELLFGPEEEEPEPKPIFAAEPGVKISGLSITSRRLLGVVIPDADVASGGCSLQLPGTAVTPPPPPPPGEFPTEPSVTLAGGDSVVVKGTVPTTNSQYDTCVGNLRDPRCVVYMIEVNPTSGTGVLEFDITADSDPTDDFDIYLYNLDETQTEVGFAGLTGPADVGGSPVEAGRYYVQVVPYTATAGNAFTLGLTLISD